MKRPIFRMTVLSLTLFVVGCGQMPSYRFGYTPGSIEWKGNIPARSLARISGLPGSRALTDDPAFKPIKDYYATIGERLGGYTPTQFQLIIRKIPIWDENDNQEIGPVWTTSSGTDGTRIANFAKGFESHFFLRPGTYQGLLFDFNPTPDKNVQVFEDSFSVPYSYDICIEVAIPGYTDAEWPDIPGSPGTGFFTRRYIGDNIFRFSPSYLMPLMAIDRIVYHTKFQAIKVILPGQENNPIYWDVSESQYGGLPNGNSGSSGGGILVPYEGLTVPASAQGINLIMSWDLNDIIEVYNNGTPDLSDDVVVLAPDAYSRLSMNVVVK